MKLTWSGAFGILFLVFGVAPLFIPAGGCVECAKRPQAKNDLMLTVTAVKGFYTEYSQYPQLRAKSDQDLLVNERNQRSLFLILRGLEAKSGWAKRAVQNHRVIVFLEGKEVKGSHPKGGFGEDGLLYDPWGGVYQFVVDTNGDGTVQVPEEWHTKDSGAVLNTTIIGFSPGKTTNPRDDVTTW